MNFKFIMGKFGQNKNSTVKFVNDMTSLDFLTKNTLLIT